MTRTKLNFILAVIAWTLAVACVLAYNFVWMPRHMEVPEPEPVLDEEVHTVIHIPVEETKEAKESFLAITASTY